MSRKEPADISLDVASSILQQLDCPRSLTALLLMQYGEWDQLVSLSFLATDYPDVQSAADAYQATVLLSKAEHLKTTFDRKKEALVSFYRAEELCKETNSRLRKNRLCPLQGDAFSNSVIHRAAHLIDSVLGKLDPEALLKGCGFGPGVSSSVKGSKVGVYYKASGKPECTADLTVMAPLFINGTYLLPSAILQSEGPASVLSQALRQVKGNTVAFVPKNAKTYRSIAVEPHINIFVQKGIGSLIRSRLRRIGINLNDQGRNQKLAKLASQTNSLATIDLSMASDTLSIELVRDLLPADWYFLLDLTRSKLGYVEDRWMKYDKFSSMGNGFTFELETLIFWALARATSDALHVKGTHSVYGDDIILPSASAERFFEVLSFCGFVPNSKKSFTTGPFRESCGEDFYLGVPIRPFFIRGQILTMHDKISLHNQIFHYALRRNVGFGRDERFLSILRDLKGNSRYLVPYDLGDVGFASSFEEASPQRAKRGHEGYLCQGFVQVPSKVRMTGYWASLYAAFSVLPSGEPTLGLTPLRGHTRGRRITISVSEWSATSTFPIYFI